MPFARSISGRVQSAMFWTAVLAAAFLAAFVVPFLFPLQHPVYSPAYTVGSNNRVGAVAVAVVALLAAAVCLRRSSGLKEVSAADRAAGAGRLQLIGSLCVVVLFSIVLGVVIVRSGAYYADAGYFTTQLRAGLVFHRALYRDIEFAYGPLLYLWPAAAVRVLGHFGWSIEAGYMASLVMVEAVGTALLYWTVSALPMTGRVKAVAFALLVFLTLDPQAGLNYTAFRFILPVASLVFLSRQQRIAAGAATAFAAAALNFAVSPELGIAFTAGCGCFALYRAITGRRFLLLLLSAVAGAAVFAMVVGRDYFRTMAEFAQGGYNDILQPAPHTYFLLVCAVVTAPMAVAAAMRAAARDRSTGKVNDAGLLLGMFIAGLVMLAPALGRCDPLHVAFNGWALFLLSCIAVDRMGLRSQGAWLAAALLFCGYTMTQEYGQQKIALERVVRRVPDPLENAGLPRLSQATQGEPVAFPLNQAGALLDRLTAHNLYEPQYLCIPAADAQAEQRTVQDMRHANYAMVPNDVQLVTQNKVNNSGLRYRMRFNYKYPVRRQPFLQGAATVAELQQHWQAVGVFGGYTLYRKVS